MNRRSPVAAVVAIGLAAVLTCGCAADGAGGGPTEAGATLAAVADTTAPSPEPTAEARPTPRFGKAFKYAAGLRVRVAPPERFRPSPWVERRPGTPMLFTIVVNNNTGEEWNPSQLHVTLRSAFQPAPQIYDAEQGIVARPEARLPHGRSVRFAVAYWVVDPDQLALEFAPGFGYQSTVVTG